MKQILLILAIFCEMAQASTLILGSSADPHVTKSAVYVSDILWDMQGFGVETAVFCGDLTNGAGRNWDTLEMTAKDDSMMSVYAEAVSQSDFDGDILSVLGNHDDKQAFVKYLGPVERTVDIREYRVITFDSHDINEVRLRAILRPMACNILCFHQPILKGKNGPRMSNSIRQMIISACEGFNVVCYVGHDHSISYYYDAESGIQQIKTSYRKSRYWVRSIFVDGELISAKKMKAGAGELIK